jgi:hypothetical protein
MGTRGRKIIGETKRSETVAAKVEPATKQLVMIVSVKLKKSVADLIKMWVEAEIEKIMGGDAAEPEGVDRAASVIRMMVDGVKPDTLTVQQLADDLGVPSEKLAALVTKCTCQSQEEKSHAKSKA